MNCLPLFCPLQQGTCSDKIRNNEEGGVDCGGPNCPACVSARPVLLCPALLARHDRRLPTSGQTLCCPDILLVPMSLSPPLLLPLLLLVPADVPHLHALLQMQYQQWPVPSQFRGELHRQWQDRHLLRSWTVRAGEGQYSSCLIAFRLQA